MDSLLKDQEDPENMVMMVVYFTIGTFEDRQNQRAGQPRPVSFHPCEYRLLFTVTDDNLMNNGKSATIISKMNKVMELLPNDILMVDQVDRTLKLNDPRVYENDNETRIKYNIGSMSHVNLLLNPTEIHSQARRWINAVNKLGNLFKNDKNKDNMGCDMNVNDRAVEERVCFPN